MQDVFRVQIPDSHHNLGSVKLDRSFGKPLAFQEMLVELSSSYERHHKVKSELVLEHIVHTAQEWVLSLQKNVSLQLRAFNLISFDENIFSDRLDCIELSILFQNC